MSTVVYFHTHAIKNFTFPLLFNIIVGEIRFSITSFVVLQSSGKWEDVEADASSFFFALLDLLSIWILAGIFCKKTKFSLFLCTTINANYNIILKLNIQNTHVIIFVGTSKNMRDQILKPFSTNLIKKYVWDVFHDLFSRGAYNLCVRVLCVYFWQKVFKYLVLYS